MKAKRALFESPFLTFYLGFERYFRNGKHQLSNRKLDGDGYFVCRISYVYNTKSDFFVKMHAMKLLAAKLRGICRILLLLCEVASLRSTRKLFNPTSLKLRRVLLSPSSPLAQLRGIRRRRIITNFQLKSPKEQRVPLR